MREKLFPLLHSVDIHVHTLYGILTNEKLNFHFLNLGRDLLHLSSLAPADMPVPYFSSTFFHFPVGEDPKSAKAQNRFFELGILSKRPKAKAKEYQKKGKKQSGVLQVGRLFSRWIYTFWMPHWHNRSLAQTVGVGDPPKSLPLLWDAIERQVPSLYITNYLFEYLLIPLFWISHGSTKTSLTMEPFLIFFKRSEFSYIPRLDNSTELLI